MKKLEQNVGLERLKGALRYFLAPLILDSGEMMEHTRYVTFSSTARKTVLRMQAFQDAIK